MDNWELRQAIIKALAEGDIEELLRLKEIFNPTKVNIIYYFGIYHDGKPTGEYFSIDGEPIMVDFSENDLKEVNNKILPMIGAICTCFTSIEQMNDFIYKRDNKIKSFPPN